MNNCLSKMSQLLTTSQAAEFLGIKKNTLEIWRVQGKSPAFLKIGKLVRYDLASLISFLEESRRKSTSDPGKNPI